MSLTDYHESFAAVYDTLYARRDVAGEVRLAADLLELSTESGSPHVLDFGCGTGEHALALAEQGISVVGFDRSEAMIAVADSKQQVAGSTGVSFACGSLAEFFHRANGLRFDGVVSFFNVLNCIDTPGEMVSHLRLMGSRLQPGCKMLVDVWNGAAVFVDQPHPGIQHYDCPDEPGHELIRITEPKLDRVNQRCKLRYRVLNLNRESGSFTQFESIHDLRFLTPVQYRHLFELADLRIVDEFPKGKPSTPITEDDWYISYLLCRDG